VTQKFGLRFSYSAASADRQTAVRSVFLAVVLKTFIHPVFGNCQSRGFCLRLTVKLLKPIFDRAHLLTIILGPRDNSGPSPSVCISVRNCRDDNSVVLIQDTGHRKDLRWDRLAVLAGRLSTQVNRIELKLCLMREKYNGTRPSALRAILKNQFSLTINQVSRSNPLLPLNFLGTVELLCMLPIEKFSRSGSLSPWPDNTLTTA
jgi:hypothetical protein